jgi:hypothetical protein
VSGLFSLRNNLNPYRQNSSDGGSASCKAATCRGQYKQGKETDVHKCLEPMIPVFVP